LRKIKCIDAVILSDYAKGVLSAENLLTIIEAANERNTFISMDPKPTNRLKISRISLMIPNKVESAQLADLERERFDEYPFKEICRKINEKYSPRNLIITLGADGMLAYGGDKRIFRVPTYAREGFDVSGAGDTSITCLTIALDAGTLLIRAANLQT